MTIVELFLLMTIMELFLIMTIMELFRNNGYYGMISK